MGLNNLNHENCFNPSQTASSNCSLHPACIPYIFELYISGMTPRSIKTIANVKFVLQTQMPGKYRLEIIDIFKNPQRTCKAQIMATPTLIKKSPLPTRTIVGNVTGRDRIIKGLNLQELKNSV